MRNLLLLRARTMNESGAPPEPALLAALAGYHAALARAGVLLDAGSLPHGAPAARVQFLGGRPARVSAVLSGTRLPLAGYTVLQARTHDEALAWAHRFPAPFGPGQELEIEVWSLGPPDDADRRQAPPGA